MDNTFIHQYWETFPEQRYMYSKPIPKFQILALRRKDVTGQTNRCPIAIQLHRIHISMRRFIELIAQIIKSLPGVIHR